ncbi:MAG: DMT family transporter [Calothrix sp. FI2-JRJ7]|jgi:drug/metabolite transporter (DMT)-like permease|nr:DMT family transporter [Calothrix sp. FI2-JRJ7]
MHHTTGKWRLGLGLSLLTIVLWGVLPIALTVALSVLDVYTVTWFRFLLSFSLLTIYLAARGKLPTLKQLRATSWKLLSAAIIFLAANYILFLKGLALTSPANAQVIIQLAPLLMSFGGLLIFRERYSWRQWCGVGILTIGLALFFHEKLNSIITVQINYLLGTGLVVLGAVAWAVYALAQKQLLRTLSSMHIMVIIYGVCAFLFLPFATPKLLFTLNYFHWGTLIFCGLNTLIAYGAFAESLEHWESSRVSAVVAAAPIVTLISVHAVCVIAPSLIVPENLSVTAIVGAVLVVAGSVAMALGK